MPTRKTASKTAKRQHADDEIFTPRGAAWDVRGRSLLVGVTAWTEPTLVKSGLFYPDGVTSAEDRLRYYAAHFPITEVDSTYYAPPARNVAHAWADRSPDGFVFDVKAYRLFTEHPTPPGSLWRDIREDLPPGLAEKRNLYVKDLPVGVRDEAMRRFVEALSPLRDAGKLGVILFQFPQWFVPGKHAFDALDALAPAVAPDRAAVELRQHLWMDEKHAERTLTFLGERDLVYVCVDEPQGFKSSVPPVVAATADDVAVVRFHGRNDDTWEKKGVTAAERFAYDYPDGELQQWVPKLQELRNEAKSVHALMNNCYRDFGVRNGATLASMLDETVDTQE